ncbi:MAG: hypothetical protein IKR54_05820 [Lachnospiraceae bacterium]|nr:hypothetical protein [Lachnospiraceae bacterium]
MARKKEMNTHYIPLVLGVTGHRDIIPEDARIARDVVRSEIRRLKALAPHTPIELLSSLAAGADRIVAEVALEEGIPLTVILPMKSELYEEDFTSEEVAGYRELLKRASNVFVAPEIEDHKEGRDYLYRQAGIYVAEHSHVLIALWDGSEPKKGGCGTAEIVDIKLKGSLELSKAPSFSPEKGFVIHIPVRRAGVEPFPERTVLPRYLGDEKTLNRVIERTEEFNRDAMKLNLSETVGLRAFDRMARVGHTADICSVKGAKRHRITVGLIAVMATLLTMSFLLYDEANMHYLIVGCGVMIVGIYVINHLAKKRDFHRKYLEYRVLAEALRVQTALIEAGYYAETYEMLSWAQKLETPWISRALAAICVYDPNTLSTTGSTDCWIDGQLAYHRRAVERAKAKSKANDRVVRVAIAITVAVYTAALVFEIFWAGTFGGSASLSEVDAEFVRTIFKLATGSLSAISLFAGSYYGKLSLDQWARDSERMVLLYEEAKTARETCRDLGELCVSLAREELSENMRWFAYQSVNGPDTPIS